MEPKKLCPKAEEGITFTRNLRKFDAPFEIYLDFEAFPVETHNTSQIKIVKAHIHKPCSFGLKVIYRDEDKHNLKPFTYVGGECVEA